MENMTRDEKDRRWRQRYGKRHTNPKLIAFECRPIDLIIIKLDKSPVFGEFVGLDRDLNLLQVKDKANHVLVKRGVVLNDLTVDCFHPLDLPCCLHHQIQVLITLGARGYIISDTFWSQLWKNPEFSFRKWPLVALVFFFVKVISMYPLSTFWSKWWIHFNKTQHISTGFWLDKLLKKSQLNHNVSTDYIPPCPQWQVRDSVDKGVEREELWASKTSHYWLDKCHLDVREADISEDVLDGGCSSNSGLIEEETRIHTDAHDKRAEWLGLPSIGVGEEIDGCPHYAHGFELVADACANRNPSRLNSVTVNWVRLIDNTPAASAQLL